MGSALIASLRFQPHSMTITRSSLRRPYSRTLTAKLHCQLICLRQFPGSAPPIIRRLRRRASTRTSAQLPLPLLSRHVPPPYYLPLKFPPPSCRKSRIGGLLERAAFCECGVSCAGSPERRDSPNEAFLMNLSIGTSAYLITRPRYVVRHPRRIRILPATAGLPRRN